LSKMVDYLVPTPLGLPKTDIYSLAETVASQLGYEPGAKLGPIIEKLNGEVVYQGLDEFVSSNAGSIVVEPGDESPGYSFKIFLPDFMGRERNRFTAAHEIGHLVLHYLLSANKAPNAGMKAARYPLGKRDAAEWEANWFAAGFLMPGAAFKQKFEESGKNVLAVASSFGVSAQAAGYQAEYLGLV